MPPLIDNVEPEATSSGVRMMDIPNPQSSVQDRLDQREVSTLQNLIERARQSIYETMKWRDGQEFDDYLPRFSED